MTKPPSLVAQVAAEYGVTPRSVRRWRAQDAPIADPAALVAWLKAHDKLPASVRGRERRRTITDQAAQAERTDWAALPAADIHARLGSLETWAGVAETHMRASISGRDAEGKPVKDPGEFAFWQKAYLAFHGAALNARLAQSKLGIDTGELIPRADLERLLTALGGRLALGIQQLRDRLAPQLTRLDYAEEIADRLEPALIIAGLLDPVAEAIHHAAGIGLPGYVAAALRAAVAEVIAQGADQLAARQTALLTATSANGQGQA